MVLISNLALVLWTTLSVQVDPSSPRAPRIGPEHALRVSIEFGSDGTTAFSGRHSDGLVMRWSLRTGGLVSSYGSAEHPFRCFAVRPLGGDVATGHPDGTLRIWQADAKDPSRILQAHRSVVSRIVWSPSSSHLVSFGHQRDMALWDMGSGTLVARYFSADEKGTHALGVFTEDGRRLAFSVGESLVRVLDPRDLDRSLTLPGHGGGVTSLCFSKDGSMLAVTTDRGEDGSSWCHVWDVSSSRPLAKFGCESASGLGPMDRIVLARFSVDGSELVTVDSFADLEIRSTDGFHVLHSTSLGDGGWPLRFRGDIHPGSDLVVWSGGRTPASVFNFRERRPAGKIACDERSNLRIHPSGDLVFAIHDHLLRVFDARTFDLRLTRVEYEDGGWLCLAPDGRFYGTPQAEAWARISIRGEPWDEASSLDPALRDPEAMRKVLGP